MRENRAKFRSRKWVFGPASNEPGRRLISPDGERSRYEEAKTARENRFIYGSSFADANQAFLRHRGDERPVP